MATPPSHLTMSSSQDDDDDNSYNDDRPTEMIGWRILKMANVSNDTDIQYDVDGFLIGYHSESSENN